MTSILNLIENQGAMMSGEVIKHLVKNDHISNVTASQRIANLKSPLHKVKGFFQDRQSFIYHANEFNSEEYFDSLLNAIQTSAKRVYALINALNYHYGVIAKKDLANYSICQLTRLLVI